MLIVFSTVTMANTGTFFSLFATFEMTDYMLLIGTGFVSASIGFMFQRAIQYEEPAKLSLIVFFQSVFQLLFDILIFQSSFNDQQIWGMVVVFGINGVKWAVGIRENFFIKKAPKEIKE